MGINNPLNYSFLVRSLKKPQRIKTNRKAALPHYHIYTAGYFPHAMLLQVPEENTMENLKLEDLLPIEKIILYPATKEFI
ncbi:hypothetical protein PEDI_34010 [Persicobacter diffluens]|uniref:Uncharacterized protein n=1 Tax=Persicobacter diffluens TaxID=981 RepID=A0AAN4VZB6_9BACT|nr:hypothetical protein PEDI_34010 [Persicobacter diffluens]